MPEIDRRPRYFDGQLLKEADFNLALNYVIERARSHGRLFHSPGIAEGLTVEAGIGSDKATVAPGIAVDALGRQIALGESRTLSLSDKSFAGKAVLVVISYFEEESDQASVGAKGFTRWHELPKVEVVLDGSAAYPEATYLRLARLSLDANGKVLQYDTSVRRLAGARLGTQADVPKLRLSREGLGDSSWPALTCGAAGRVDLASDLLVGRTLTVGGGSGAPEGSYSVYFAADTSDRARIVSEVAGGQTRLRLEVGDDYNDELVLATFGWKAGQRGPVHIQGGTINLQIEDVSDRSLNVANSSGKPLLLARNDGNVGIGTADPKARLEINSGDPKISPILALSTPGAEDFFSIYGARQDGQSIQMLWRRGLLSFGTATSFGGQAFSEKMRITETGNVGIGTRNPEERLHIGGNLRLDAGTEISFVNNGKIRSFSDHHAIFFKENKLEIREAGDLIFSPGATDAKETAKVVMLSSGNVGIGTTNPTAGLHILNRSATGGALVIENRAGNFTHFDYPDGKNYLRGTTILADLGGNVGVGTGSPRTRLEVTGDLLLDNGGPDGARLIWWSKEKDKPEKEWRARNYFGTLDFFPGENKPAALSLSVNSNVGIGTSSPAEKLHVAGNARIDGILSVLRASDGANAGYLNLGREATADNFWHITQRTGDQDKLMIFRRDPGVWKGPYLTITTDGKVALNQEPWSTVRDAGSAGPVTGVFNAPWRNNGVWGTAAFFKDSLGIVHLRGLVTQGTGLGKLKNPQSPAAIAPYVIFILPENYRPAAKAIFAISTYDDTVGRIDIDEKGNVIVISADKNWLSLDGITFRAEAAQPIGPVGPVGPVPSDRFTGGQITLNPGNITPG